MQENVAKLYPNPETSAKVLDCKLLAFADTLGAIICARCS